MSIDTWWSAYMRTCSIGQRSVSIRALGSTGLADHWEALDPWWDAYTDSTDPISISGSRRALVNEQLTESWGDIEPWWDVYTEIGHEKAIDIAELLDRSDEVWEQSAASFETDPLAVAVTRNNGPLLPSKEEDWSRWLANLLRHAPALVTELFDLPVDRPPDEVIRETRLSRDEGGYRRPDILVRYPDRGISIEVKLGDTHYGKTAETARLTEREFSDQAWTHTLLLPERYTGHLQANVEPSVSDKQEGVIQIEWDDPGPVSVVYWREVTAALRNLLLRGDTVNDHWEANAYLFCASVEQRIMNFAPKPLIERIAQPTGFVDESKAFTLAGELEEQLSYLRAR
jgi:hypothetical protein